MNNLKKYYEEEYNKEQKFPPFDDLSDEQKQMIEETVKFALWQLAKVLFKSLLSFFKK